MVDKLQEQLNKDFKFDLQTMKIFKDGSIKDFAIGTFKYEYNKNNKE